MVGFGLVYGGAGAVFWSSLARVISSWVISPLIGALVSFLVYKCIRRVCSPSLEMELSNGPLPYIIFGYAVGLIMITYIYIYITT